MFCSILYFVCLISILFYRQYIILLVKYPIFSTILYYYNKNINRKDLQKKKFQKCLPLDRKLIKFIIVVVVVVVYNKKF